MKRTFTLVLIGSALVATTVAEATDVSDAIKSRRNNYKEIGGAFKTIGDEIKTSAPLFDVIKPAAAEILRRGSMQMDFFPVGSGPESQQKTKSLALIWAEQDNFHQLNENFIDSAQQLKSAIDSGDVGAIAAAHKTLGKACKSCHDRYREPD
ncbi:MAG TPA: cytochrome c [Spongiibacteraceae bacterium]|nr:cytochrome c [Spongiibacteraceae bacterium]